MRGKRIPLIAIVLLSVANAASADTFGTDANQFTIDFVNISSATNPTSGLGIVNHNYRVSTYEITNDQWNKFESEYGTVTGSPSFAYEHDTYWTGTNVPTNNVSWYEAAQFVNWLNTSSGYQAAYKFTGTQGTNDYTFTVWEAGDAGYNSDNPYRNSNTYYFLPTEDEWVKAAYWNGTNLQTYATPGDIVPVARQDTNYEWVAPWDVGSGSQELNGTYDMMGNIEEWTETPSGFAIRTRGGSYYTTLPGIRSYVASSLYANDEDYETGFRVASVPEPATLLLLGFGVLIATRRNK